MSSVTANDLTCSSASLLEPHSCFHCEKLTLDFSSDCQDAYKTHDFYINPESAAQSGRDGCKFLALVSQAFYDGAVGAALRNVNDFGLRITTHCNVGTDGFHLDLDACSIAWVSNVENFQVDMMMAMSVFAYSDNQTAQYVKMRPVNQIVDSQQFFALIKKWLIDCHTTHASCRAADTWLPSRVVDVSNFQESKGPVLMNTLKPRYEPCSGHYAALSYCWGTQANLGTTKANVKSHEEDYIPWQQLPRTIQHAIRVCQELGIRYLWIDALCIVQDDPDDVEVGLSNMNSIYSAAFVTIVAARAQGAHEGFLGPREPLASSASSFTLTYTAPAGVSGTVVLQDSFMDPADASDIEAGVEPTNRRCWTYQERFMSPRLLDFGTMSTSWTCRSSVASSQLTDGYEHVGISATWLEGQKPRGQRYERYASWHRIVEQYTQRRLSKETDKLVAIAAIAVEYDPSSLTTYVAGLWKHGLPQELMWEHSEMSERLPRPSTYVAPTWSWASIQTQVDYPLDSWKDLSSYECCIEVLDCQVTPALRSVVHGAVIAGHLELNGTVTSVLCNMEGESFRWLDCPLSEADLLAPSNLDATLAPSTLATTVIINDAHYLPASYLPVYVLDDEEEEKYVSIGLILARGGEDEFTRLGSMIYQWNPQADYADTNERSIGAKNDFRDRTKVAERQKMRLL